MRTEWRGSVAPWYVHEQLLMPAGQLHPQKAAKSLERTQESHCVSPASSEPLNEISLSLPWKRQWISLYGWIGWMLCIST